MEDILVTLYRDLNKPGSEERDRIYREINEQMLNERDPVKRGILHMMLNSFYGNYPYNKN